MIYTCIHLAVALISAGTVAVLLRTSWQVRSPHVAVLLWQCAIGGFACSVIGLLLSLGLAERGDVATLVGSVLVDRSVALSHPQWFAVGAAILLAAWLSAILVEVLWRTWRRRAEVRSLLTLVGNRDSADSGLYVVEHPALAAYCLPGRQSSVVISTGTINALADAELRSVLAHERAHARERHDLALLPVVIACRTLPGTRLAAAVRTQVALLVEICADEAASREYGRAALSNALRRFGAMSTAPVPDGTLGATDAVLSRCQRLDHPPRALPAYLNALLITAALLLPLTPLTLLA